MDAKIVLYPRQTEAQRSTARALLLAGEGGGRSYALRAILAILCGENPGTIAALLAPDGAAVLDCHVYGPGGLRELLAPWIEDGSVTFRQTGARFANGSELRWAAGDRTPDLRRLQEADRIDVLAVDDAERVPQDVAAALARRVVAFGRPGRLLVASSAAEPPWLTANAGAAGVHVVTAAPADLPAALRRPAVERDFRPVPEFEAVAAPEEIREYLEERHRRDLYAHGLRYDPDGQPWPAEEVERRLAEDRDRCAADAFWWFDHWAWVPLQQLAPGLGLSEAPLMLWPAQRELVTSILSWIDQGEDGAVVKGRNLGATWTTVSLILWLWLFRPGFLAKVLTRRGASVDDFSLDSPLHMLRWHLRRQPEHLVPTPVNHPRPGPGEYHDSKGRFLKGDGNEVTGETTTENSGAGGRRQLVLFDEMARVEPAIQIAAWRALDQVARCRVAISTPESPGDHFQLLTDELLPQDRVLRMSWRCNPNRTEDWFRGLLREHGGQLTKEERARQHECRFVTLSSLLVVSGHARSESHPGTLYDEWELPDGARENLSWVATMDFGSGPSFTVFTLALLEYLKDAKHPRAWVDLCLIWQAEQASVVASEIREALDEYAGRGTAYGDPAGWNRESDQESWGSRLNAAGAEIHQLDAWYNEAKAITLTLQDWQQMLDEGTMRVHRSRAGYFWEAIERWELQAPKGVPVTLLHRPNLKPKKDSYSHPGDTGRYLAGVILRKYERRRKPETLPRAPVPFRPRTGFDRLPARRF